ncbi:hypothetical protein SAMN05216226_1215 [Halovenus aranensis]|uniref:Uncharacterized protein n=1 Tax=Halovenus aranensis TaxID=890420 RepID=A0A1G8ZES7_9EURY|nr:hypothetical protein [Halovenus aranensis]SDK12905.1 hypothetical protein SAMN05216226_1215 [Halovenus aranensis]
MSNLIRKPKIGIKWYLIGMSISAIILAHMIVVTWNQIFPVVRDLGPTGTEGELARQGILSFLIGLYVIWLGLYTMDVKKRRQGVLLGVISLLLSVVIYVFRDTTPLNFHASNGVALIAGLVLGYFFSDVFGGSHDLDIKQTFQKSRESTNGGIIPRLVVVDEDGELVRFPVATYGLIVLATITVGSLTVISILAREHLTASEIGLSAAYVFGAIAFMGCLFNFIRFNFGEYGSSTQFAVIGPKGSGKTYFALGSWLYICDRDNEDYEFVGYGNNDDMMSTIVDNYRRNVRHRRDIKRDRDIDKEVAFDWFLGSTEIAAEDDSEELQYGEVSFDFNHKKKFGQPTISVDTVDHPGEILKDTSKEFGNPVSTDGGNPEGSEQEGFSPEDEIDETKGMTEVCHEELTEILSDITEGHDRYRIYNQLRDIDAILYEDEPSDLEDDTSLKEFKEIIDEIERTDDVDSESIRESLQLRVMEEMTKIRDDHQIDWRRDIDQLVEELQPELKDNPEGMSEIISVIRNPESQTDDYQEVQELVIGISNDNILDEEYKDALINVFEEKIYECVEDYGVLRREFIDIAEDLVDDNGHDVWEHTLEILQEIEEKDIGEELSGYESEIANQMRKALYLAKLIKEVGSEEGQYERIIEGLRNIIVDVIISRGKENIKGVIDEREVASLLHLYSAHALATLDDSPNGLEELVHSRPRNPGLKRLYDEEYLTQSQKNNIIAEYGEFLESEVPEDWVEKIAKSGIKRQIKQMDKEDERERELEKLTQIDPRKLDASEYEFLPALLLLSRKKDIEIHELKEELEKELLKTDEEMEAAEAEKPDNQEAVSLDEKESSNESSQEGIAKDPRDKAVHDLKTTIDTADKLVILLDSERAVGYSPTTVEGPADEWMEVDNLRVIAENADVEEIILVATKADYYIEEFENYMRDEKGVKNPEPAGEDYDRFRDFVTRRIENCAHSLMAPNAADVSTIYPVWFETAIDKECVVAKDPRKLDSDAGGEPKKGSHGAEDERIMKPRTDSEDGRPMRYPKADEYGQLIPVRYGEVIKKLVD